LTEGQDNDLFYENTEHKAYHAGPYIGYSIVMDYINRTGSKKIEQLMDHMSDIQETVVAKT
jgi:hypothetical protein